MRRFIATIVTIVMIIYVATGIFEVKPEESGVTYMVADWTNYDPIIGAFVREHGRNGIPLYVLYSGKRGAAPVILPQLLTRNIVMEALAGVSE